MIRLGRCVVNEPNYRVAEAKRVQAGQSLFGGQGSDNVIIDAEEQARVDGVFEPLGILLVKHIKLIEISDI